MKTTKINKAVNYFLDYHKDVLEEIRYSFVLEWWLLNANDFGFSGDDDDAEENEELFCKSIMNAIYK